MTRAATLATVSVLAAASPSRADPIEVTPRAALIGGDLASAAGFFGGLAWNHALEDDGPPEPATVRPRAQFRWSHMSYEMAGSLCVGGLAGYLAIGPYVHARTGHPIRAVVSGALRVGLPLVGLELGWVLDADDTTMAVLASAGAASAMVIDWVTVRGAPRPRLDAGAATTYLIPVAGGALVGVAGAL